jgi:Ca-activated chloride channel family protein
MHDGKDGALLPKMAPVEEGPPTAPDFHRAGTESTMLQTGTQGTLLQTGTEGTLLQTGTAGTVLQTGVERVAPPLNVDILIDCSHSMKEGFGGMLAMGGEQKMEAAKRVLQETMAMIPADVNVGLRVFGQSFTNDPYLDCQQSALLVPIGLHNRRSIIESVRQIRPFGLTPLTYALHEAANDLQHFEGKKQIILISDGAETCGSDPCMFIRELIGRGFDIKIDIVGLGLARDHEAKAQLNCIANTSGGKFYDSNTAAELVDNIRKIVGEAKVSGKVLTKMKDPSLLTKPGQAPPADFAPNANP